MVGPTGVGKTEIARRLAKLVDAPFVKVEATKFTEVGYVGRDVESIIRDLVENASVRDAARSIRPARRSRRARRVLAEERIIDAAAASEPQKPRSTSRLTCLLGNKPEVSRSCPPKEEDSASAQKA